MRTAIALTVLALLVVAVGCSGTDSVAPAPSEDPVVDTFDQGLEDTTADEDFGDLESLDEDLAAFE